jgi:crossover junction endodeoxyribonuclease RuvC
VRVLGIDPGSHCTGWGVVVSEGSRLLHVASGAIEVNGGTLPQRLRDIGDGLDRVIEEHAPEAVSVESVFHARNAKSALMLGHARGVALLCAARCELPVFEYTAGQIKQATTGRGRADKQQVQSMVQIMLDHRQAMSLDTSDALAAAICHAHMETSPTAQLLRGLSRGRGKPSEVGR